MKRFGVLFVVVCCLGVLCLAQEEKSPLEKAKDEVKALSEDAKIQEAAVTALEKLVKEGVKVEDALKIVSRGVKDKLDAAGLKKLCDGVVAILKADEKEVSKELKYAAVKLIAELAEADMAATDGLEIANLAIKAKFSADDVNKLTKALKEGLEKKANAAELAKFVKEKIGAGVKGEELIKAINDKVKKMTTPEEEK